MYCSFLVPNCLVFAPVAVVSTEEITSRFQSLYYCSTGIVLSKYPSRRKPMISRYLFGYIDHGDGVSEAGRPGVCTFVFGVDSFKIQK